MAQKIIIELDINAAGVAPTLNALKANLKTLKNEIGGVAVDSTAFKTLTEKIAVSNTELKAINKSFTSLKTESTAGANSIKGLEDKLNELKNSISTVDVGSASFKKMKTEILATDTQLKNTKKSIEGLDLEAMSGHIGKLAGGISASFTAVSAIAGKGNKDLEAFTSQLVQGIAVTQGIKGAIEGWGSAQKLLNLAMAANPIGVVIASAAALAAVIGLLVFNMNDYSAEAEVATANQNALNDALATGNINIIKLNIELAELQKNYKLATTLKAELAKAQEEQAIISAVIEYRKNVEGISEAIQEQIDAEVSLQETITGNNIKRISLLDDLKNTYDLEARDRIKSELSILNTIIDNDKKVLASAIENTNYKIKLETGVAAKVNNIRTETALAERNRVAKEASEAKDRNEKKVKDEKDTYNKIIELRLSLENEIDNVNKRALLASIEDNKKFEEIVSVKNENLKKLNDKEIADNVKKNNDIIDAERKKFEELYDNAVKNKTSLLELRKAEEDLVELTNKLNKESTDLAIKKNKEEGEAKIANAKKVGNDLYNLEIKQKELLRIIEEDKEKFDLEALDKNYKEEDDALQAKYKLFKDAQDAKIELSDAEKYQMEVIDRDRILVAKKYNKDRYLIESEYSKKRIELASNLASDDLQRDLNSVRRKIELARGNTGKVLALKKEEIERVAQLEQNAEDISFNIKIKSINKSLKEKLMSEEVANEAKKQLEADYLRDKEEKNAITNTRIHELELEQIKKVTEAAYGIYSKLATAVLNKNVQTINDNTHYKLESLNNEETALAQQLDNNIISQEQYTARLKLIEQEKYNADLQNRQKVAQAEKDAGLVTVAIETAIAIVKSLGNPLEIGIAIATGLAQAAVIETAPIPTYARGGLLNGPSHSNGGIPVMANGGQIAEAEGGEGMINKNSMSSPVLRAIASLVNEAGGGVSFSNIKLSNIPSSSQGNNTAVIDNKSLAAIVGAISAIPVTNVATDTNKIIRKVQNIEQRAIF